MIQYARIIASEVAVNYATIVNEVKLRRNLESQLAIDSDPRYLRAQWMLDNQITGPDDLIRFWKFLGWE